MKFTELDAKMRVFETAHDHCVLPGMFIVVRLDGRSFTKLTKEKHQFEAPYDTRFRDLMVNTARHLMDVGVGSTYAYTQSDEISIALPRDDTSFNRKTRKLISVLAGEASARFTLDLGDLACFDARVSQLPNTELLVDYFRWRAQDAHRNALNSHCYWALRNEGVNARDATAQMLGLSVSDKNEFLFARGTNFNDLPAWQRRGAGVLWREFDKEGVDPRSGESRTARRRELHVELELPMKDAYSEFLRSVFATGEPAGR